MAGAIRGAACEFSAPCWNSPKVCGWGLYLQQTGITSALFAFHWTAFVHMDGMSTPQKAPEFLSDLRMTLVRPPETAPLPPYLRHMENHLCSKM